MKKVLFWVVLCLFLPAFVFAAEKGVITGTIVDSKSGEPLIEAGVEVVQTGKKVFTDLDGKYTLQLPVGQYDIRVFYPEYQGQRVKGVEVNADKPALVNLSLAAKASEAQVVEVTVEAAKATEATQLLIRKAAPAVEDRISAETIAQQPDSDVASIVERAPGVTVKGDKFVFIRGLGERNVSVTFNGAMLPSTEKERKVVPLDLFSADVVESINVIKTYTPDLWADFVAGVVQINTKDYPEAFEMKMSAKTKYNSETTGKDFKTVEGGDTDWLGFDDGTRDMPDRVGDLFEDPYGVSDDFRNVWTPTTDTALPSFGGDFYIGNKIGKFGFVFDFNYDYELQTRHEDRKVFAGNNYQKFAGEVDTWDKTYSWNALLNMGYELSPTDKISFKNFYTRKAVDEVKIAEGFNSNDSTCDGIEGCMNRRTRDYWSEEGIYSSQLLGEHNIAALKSNVRWLLAYGNSTLYEPDVRETVYRINSDHDGLFSLPVRSWTELYENRYEAHFDWEVDLKDWLNHPLKVKFGPAYSYTDRNYWSRWFGYQDSGGAGLPNLPPEEIFWNIGPYGYYLAEGEPNKYDASHELIAGYIMLDTPYFFFDNLRFIGGLRVESSDQKVEAKQRVESVDKLVEAGNESVDYAPSLNLVYSPKKDMNLRLGFSQTVSRPVFRELSPFGFEDFTEYEFIWGNPELKDSGVSSYDFRWEWFLGPEELTAVSLFYKEITDPIETVIAPPVGGSYITTYENSEKADNYGIELEVRKNLGFITPELSPFNVYANYTYVKSKVKPTQEFSNPKLTSIAGTTGTSASRPMEGQADHVFNAMLEYKLDKWDLTARLLYNYSGEKIYQVGISSLGQVGSSDDLVLPDIIEEPTSSLDAVLIKKFGKWALKLAATNLLNGKVVRKQDGEIVKSYRSGVSVGFKLSREI